MEDKFIIDLYWARNEMAISETDTKYGRMLHSISYNILSSWEDSEECVGDTYIRAWNSMPPNKPNSLIAYLGRIVRNISIDVYRKDRAKKRYNGIEILLSELAECIPDSTTTESRFEEKSFSKLISKWLYTLSKEDRLLFVQRYWYGYSLKELSITYNLNSNKLAGKMYRLRKALKEELESEGIFI